MYAEPQDLDREELTGQLRKKWHIDVATLKYEPIGFGTHHYFTTGQDRARWWVNVDDLHQKAWLTGDTPTRFVDLRRSLAAATDLRNSGLPFVHAPLEAVDGSVLHPVGDHYTVSVYAFIEGKTYEHGEPLSSGDRISLLTSLGSLHSAAIPADPPRRDTLIVPDREAFFEALDDTDGRWDTGPFGEPARELLASSADRARRMFDRYDELAATVSQSRDRWVMTHGEPHFANVIRTSSGQLLLIDWDTIGLGPPERDLWMAAPVGDAEWNAYASAGGSTTVDRTALDCYRLWWDLCEISVYTWTFRQPHIGDGNTRVAWKELQEYLAE